MANNKDSSVFDQSKSSSFIPEPPSSPSLISLPDEEDELTPSLGLENDDLVIVVIHSYLFKVVSNGEWPTYWRLNPLNPKVKIWILICCLYLFPTEVVGRSW